MTCRLSIVTPTLNAARFLAGCLQNVRDQAYADVEHIIVDGGSTDATADLARNASDVIWLERIGSNQAQAINTGLRVAEGDVLAWLNADDEYAPGTLRLVAERFAADPDLGVLYGDCDVIDSEAKLQWRMRPGPYDFRRLLRRGNYIAQPASFIHRRVFERVGFLDESFDFGMDYEFWLRVRACRVEYLPRVLARFRWYSTSKTARNQFANWRELLRAVKRHGGGWTPELAWSFSRMLMTEGRLGSQRTLQRVRSRARSRSATLD